MLSYAGGHVLDNSVTLGDGMRSFAEGHQEPAQALEYILELAPLE